MGENPYEAPLTLCSVTVALTHPRIAIRAAIYGGLAACIILAAVQFVWNWFGNP